MPMTVRLREPSLRRFPFPWATFQDPEHTQVLLVTLPETTPVSEATALQEDLRRAGIEPYAWVVNRALAGSGASDPLLRQRMAGEVAQIARLKAGLAPRLYLLPGQAEAPVGLPALRSLAA
jgi:arsenite-transporting ATPase